MVLVRDLLYPNVIFETTLSQLNKKKKKLFSFQTYLQVIWGKTHSCRHEGECHNSVGRVGENWYCVSVQPLLPQVQQLDAAGPRRKQQKEQLNLQPHLVDNSSEKPPPITQSQMKEVKGQGEQIKGVEAGFVIVVLIVQKPLAVQVS